MLSGAPPDFQSHVIAAAGCTALGGSDWHLVLQCMSVQVATQKPVACRKKKGMGGKTKGMGGKAVVAAKGKVGKDKGASVTTQAKNVHSCVYHKVRKCQMLLGLSKEKASKLACKAAGAARAKFIAGLGDASDSIDIN